jgi:prolyl 4-hydroxylase
MKIKKFPFHTFMAGFYVSNDFCNRVMKWSSNNEDLKREGHCISKTGEDIVDKNYKESTDQHFNIITAYSLYIEYKEYLKKFIVEYIKIYEQFKLNAPLAELEGINFQHYKPSQGFKVFHAERVNNDRNSRVLVFMTYLNNVKNGGTEFANQNIKTEAEKGLTLIWPSDWTHAHRGVVSKQDKYILTGWLSYE